MTAEDEEREHEEEKPSKDVKTILPACLVKSLNAGGPPLLPGYSLYSQIGYSQSHSQCAITARLRYGATEGYGELRRAPDSSGGRASGEPPGATGESPESRRRAAGEPLESRRRIAGEPPQNWLKVTACDPAGGSQDHRLASLASHRDLVNHWR